jgi:hypothetical protein
MPKLVAVKKAEVESVTVEIERDLALALLIICNKVGGSPEGIRGLFSDGRNGVKSLSYILRRSLGCSWSTDKLQEDLGAEMQMDGGGMGTITFMPFPQ